VTSLARDDAAVGATTGRYLYAIIDSEGGEGVQPLGLKGLEGNEVYKVVAGPVAAVVSDVPARKIRPERRKLAAHHEVLKGLMHGHTVLPMAFGLIADNLDAVRRILRLNTDTITDRLDRVRGRVEMGVRVAWEVPNIFEFAIGQHPRLRELRDYIFRGGRQPSQDEMIEIGRQFDRCITGDREDCLERVVAVVSDHCVETVSNKPRDECEVMNLACLVDRDCVTEFEHAVYEAARQFDEHYAFDINGPWPAHNFADVALHTS
jgi:Gas vesicle synthesis protein GvpL/GvpF